MKSAKAKKIKEEAKKGISYLVFREILLKIITFISQLFIFRLLQPNDYGIYTILAFIITFFELFTDIGLTQAIIQKKEEINSSVVSQVYLFKQAISILIFCMIFMFTSNILSFYHGFSAYSTMLRTLSIIILIKPLTDIIIALFERELKYKYVTIIDIISTIFYQIIVLSSALLGFGVWSFINAVIGMELAKLICAVYLKRNYIKPFFRIESIKNLVKFGLFMQLYSLQLFLHDAIIPVVAGKFKGSYSVGILDWSYSIASLPKYITDNYGRVAFAAFSRLQDNEKELEKMVGNSTLLLTTGVCYFGVIIFSIGHDLIYYFFTPKWLPGLQPLYLYTFVIVVNTIMTPIISLLPALGKSKNLLYLSLLFNFVEWPLAVFLTIKNGYIGVAQAEIIIILISVVGFTYVTPMKKFLLRLIMQIIPVVVCSVAVILLMAAFNYLTEQTFILMFIKIFIVTIVYFLGLLVFSRKIFSEIVHIFIYNFKHL